MLSISLLFLRFSPVFIFRSPRANQLVNVAHRRQFCLRVQRGIGEQTPVVRRWEVEHGSHLGKPQAQADTAAKETPAGRRLHSAAP